MTLIRYNKCVNYSTNRHLFYLKPPNHAILPLKVKDLEVIIGLEVHAQMNTKTKMFCGCDNDAFGKPPNTTVCPICMGHPGTLPVINSEAIKKAMKAAAALKCEIQEDSHMDRKNYFYPDLPMGFQISQYDFPLSKSGVVRFDVDASSPQRCVMLSGASPEASVDEAQQRRGACAESERSAQHDTKQCGITRLHIENDAGKLMHAGGRSYCDYNRAGTPLMEIVTEPDLRNADDAMAFAKELQRILISVDASEADMYKGMMRFDASISLRPVGDDKLYPRSEIKNLNSFKSLGKALVFEEKRLRELWEEDKPQDKEVTVHWDDNKEVGVVMREKESAADYRYFPEPDIPPFCFDREMISDASASVGELPEEKKKRYLESGLSEAQAQLLTGEPRLAEYFDEVVEGIRDQGSTTKRVASVVLTQLVGFLKTAEKNLSDGPGASAIIELLKCVDDGVISANSGKSVLEKMVASGKSAKEIIDEEGLGQISDSSELEKIVKRAVEANPKAVEDVKNGKEKARAAIVGFVMKETNGQADPGVVNRLIDAKRRNESSEIPPN